MTRVFTLIALNALLLAALLRPAPPSPRVHPLAPPLTRIAALGDHPLDARAPPPPPPAELLRLPERGLRPTPGQRALLGRATPHQQAIGAAVDRSTALRVAVERDAAALAEALGPERVAAFIAQKERFSAEVGETRVWAELAGVSP